MNANMILIVLLILAQNMAFYSVQTFLDCEVNHALQLRMTLLVYLKISPLVSQ